MPEPETAPDFLRRHLAARFSCRAFLPDPVPEAVIADLFDIARWTASWNNVQPWDDILVTRPETTRALAEELLRAETEGVAADPDFPFPTRYDGAYQERRRACGYGLYGALGIAREDRAARERQGLENYRFFGAPHVALITVPSEQGVYGVLDAGGFITAFMLAAETHGLATIAQAALARHAKLIRARFAIPDTRAFVCGIAFGRADDAHQVNGFRPGRAPAEALFRFV